MATDQDFTFPTFSDAISSAVDSPPLWSSSPANSPLCATNKQAEESKEEKELEEYRDSIESHKEMENYNSRRKSFSWIERGHYWRNRIQENEEEEENMDMLWEDFNEERQNTSDDDDDDNNMGCVQMLKPAALRLSKNGQKAIVSTRQNSTNSATGFLMFIKVLKKVVLLNYNTSHSHSHSRSLGLNQKNHCSVGKRRRPNNLSW